MSNLGFWNTVFQQILGNLPSRSGLMLMQAKFSPPLGMKLCMLLMHGRLMLIWHLLSYTESLQLCLPDRLRCGMHPSA